MNPLFIVMVCCAQAASVHEPPVEDPEIRVDWMRFNSGEWFNGEFKGLVNDEVEFDADKAGLAEWDFADVTDLHFHGKNNFVFEDRTAVTGEGRITTTDVIIRRSDGIEVRRSREELLQIIEGTLDRVLDRWSLDAWLQTNLTRGNSEQIAATLGADLRRVDNGSRAQLTYDGRLGLSLQQIAEGTEDTLPETEVRRNTNRHDGRLIFDLLFSSRFFWRITDTTALYDEFQDIELRLQPSTTLGIELIDRDGLALRVNGGAALQYTRFISDTDTLSTGGPFLTGTLEWDITSDVELDASTELFIDLALGDSDDNQSSAKTRIDLEVDITDAFEIKVGLVHNYVADPAGTNPVTGLPVKSSDIQFLTGFEVELD